MSTPQVAVPQTDELGAEAKVDFGEFYTWLDGTWTRSWLLVMRLSGSGRPFHHVFGNQCGESFYEGHNLAFTYFSGVQRRPPQFRTVSRTGVRGG